MRMLIPGLAAFAVAAVEAVAAAQGAHGVRPQPGGDQNKVICRTEEVTGSRLMQTRKCMTRAQWTQLRKETRETIEKAQKLYFNCREIFGSMGC